MSSLSGNIKEPRCKLLHDVLRLQGCPQELRWAAVLADRGLEGSQGQESRQGDRTERTEMIWGAFWRTDQNDCFGRNVRGPRELRRIVGSKIGPPRSDRALVNPRRTDRNDCFGLISGSGIQTGRSDRKNRNDLGSILRRPESPENGPERLPWSVLRVRFRTDLVNVGSRNGIKPGRSDRSIWQQ